MFVCLLLTFIRSELYTIDLSRQSIDLWNEEPGIYKAYLDGSKNAKTFDLRTNHLIITTNSKLIGSNTISVSSRFADEKITLEFVNIHADMSDSPLVTLNDVSDATLVFKSNVNIVSQTSNVFEISGNCNVVVKGTSQVNVAMKNGEKSFSNIFNDLVMKKVQLPNLKEIDRIQTNGLKIIGQSLKNQDDTNGSPLIAIEATGSGIKTKQVPILSSEQESTTYKESNIIYDYQILSIRTGKLLTMDSIEDNSAFMKEQERLINLNAASNVIRKLPFTYTFVNADVSIAGTGTITKALIDSAWADFKAANPTGNPVKNVKFVGSTANDKLTFVGFSSYTLLESVDFSQCQNEVDIQPNAITSCPNLYTFVFPNKLNTIGQTAFENDVALTEIQIPTVLGSIDAQAFHGCAGLKTVYFTGHFNYANNLFDGCTSLKKIFYCEMRPPTATTSNTNLIGTITGYEIRVNKNYFEFKFGNVDITDLNKTLNSDCSEFYNVIFIKPFKYTFVDSEVTIEGSGTLNKTFVENAFAQYQQINPDAPKITDVKFTGDGSFILEKCSAWEGLKTLDFSSCKETLDITSYSFMDCIELNSVAFPPLMSRIGVESFANCTSLTDLRLPSTKLWIDLRAFKGCTSLTTVFFTSFIKFGTGLFTGCTKLKNVYYCSQEQPLKASAVNTDYTEDLFGITISNLKVSQEYKAAKLGTVTITPTMKVLDNNCNDINNPNHNIIEGTFTFYFDRTQVTIDGTGELGQDKLARAFRIYKDTHLDSVTPSRLIVNTTRAITIPKGGFSNNDAITQVDMSSSTGLIDLMSNSFENCPKLSIFTFPPNLKRIGVRAFYNDISITELRIPAVQMWIDTEAFKGCGRLSKLYFTGYFNYGPNLIDECYSLKNIYYCGIKPPQTAAPTNPEVYTTHIFGEMTGYTLSVNAKYENNTFGDVSIDYLNKTLNDDCSELDNIIFEGTFSYTFLTYDVIIEGAGEINKTFLDNAFAKYVKVKPTAKLPTRMKFQGNGDIIIKYDAFKNWLWLSKVDLGSCTGLITIFSKAFENCIRLSYLTLPMNVKRLGVEAFRNTSITMARIGSVEEYVDLRCFKDCKKLQTVFFTEFIKYGAGIFDGCTALKHIYYCSSKPPERAGTDTSKGYTFKIFGDINATQYTLRVNKNYTGTQIGDITITSAMKSLDEQCNDENDKSSSLLVGPFKYYFVRDSVTIEGTGILNKSRITAAVSIYSKTHLDIPKITKLLFNDTKDITLDHLYGWTDLTSVDMSKCTGNVIFNTNAFNNCPNLDTFVFPPNIVQIGIAAFLLCKSLTELRIPPIQTFIDKSAFERCTSLETVYFTGKFNYGPNLFYGCTNLKAIYYCSAEVPQKASNKNGYTTNIFGNIVDYKLYLNKKYPEAIIGNVKVDESQKVLDDNCAENSNSINYETFTFTFEGKTVTIKGSGKLIKEQLDNATAKYREVDKSAPAVTTMVLTGTNSYDIDSFSNWKELETLDFSPCKGSIQIQSHAFENCTKLSKVTFPNYLKQVGIQSFANCALVNLKLPTITNWYDKYCFENNKQLLSVFFVGMFKYGNGLFQGCTSLETISVCYKYPPFQAAYSKAYTDDIFGLGTQEFKLKLNKKYSSAKFGNIAVTDNMKVLDETCLDENLNTGDVVINYPFTFYFEREMVSITGEGKITKKLVDDAYAQYAKTHVDTPTLRRLRFNGTENITVEGFNGWNELNSVSMGSCWGHVTISTDAFRDCPNLNSFEFPIFLVKLGVETFANDIYLTELQIPPVEEYIDNRCFLNCKRLEKIYFIGKFNYGVDLVRGCTSLKYIYYCSSKPPQKATDKNPAYTDDIFGNATFYLKLNQNYEGTKFAKYTINNKFKVLNDDCSEQNNVVITNPFTYTFLESYVIIEGSGAINKGNIDFALGQYRKKNPKAPKVKSIKFTGAIQISNFSYWSELEKVDMSSSKGTCVIASNSIKNCKNLTSFEFPPGLDYIGINAFENCVELTDIHVSVKRWIDIGAFKGCTGLKSVFILGAFQFGTGIFDGCTGIVNIYCCSPTAPTIANTKNSSYTSNIFGTINSNYKLKLNKNYTASKFGNIDVTAEMKVLDDQCNDINNQGDSIIISPFTYYFFRDIVSITGAGKISNVEVSKAIVQFRQTHAQFVETKRMVFNGTGNIVFADSAFLNWGELLSVDMSNCKGTVEANSHAFEKCSKLNTFIFPPNLVKLGVDAFADDISLTEIRIPAVSKWIDQGCFRRCTKLEKVYLTGRFDYGPEIFEGCVNLRAIYYCSSYVPQKASLTSPSYTTHIFGNITGFILRLNKNYPDVEFGDIKVEDSMLILDDKCSENTNIIVKSPFTFKFIGSNVNVQGSGTITKALIDQAYAEYLKVEPKSPAITSVTLFGSSNFVVDKFTNWTTLEKVDMSSCTGVNVISSMCFSGCTKLKEFAFPPTLKQTGIESFANTNISDVKISVTDFIDKRAFKDCKNLETVFFISKFNFGSAIFEGCTKLKYIFYCATTVPAKASNNEGYTDDIFGNLNKDYQLKVNKNYPGDKMGNVNVTKEMKVLDSYCNDVTNLGNSLIIPPFTYYFERDIVTISGAGKISKSFVDKAYNQYKLTHIDAVPIQRLRFNGTGNIVFDFDAFKGWKEVISVDMQDNSGESTINSKAFMDCTSLTTFNFPPNIYKIGVQAFANCVMITEFRIPGIKEYIDSQCFLNCKRLQNIYFLGDLNYGNNLIDGCPVIKNIYYCGTTPPSIASPKYPNTIFGNVTGFALKLNQNYNGTKFADITVSPALKVLNDQCSEQNNIVFISPFSYTFIEETVLIDGSGEIKKLLVDNAYTKYLTMNPNASMVTSLKFKGASNINFAYNAFENWNDLEKVDMSLVSGLVDINSKAFKNCASLRSVTFPPNLKKVGIEAFMGCGLTEVRLPSVEQWYDIHCFQDNKRLASVFFTGNFKFGTGIFEGCSGLKYVYVCSEVPPEQASKDASKGYTNDLFGKVPKFDLKVNIKYASKLIGKMEVGVEMKVLDDNCNDIVHPTSSVIIQPFTYTFDKDTVSIVGAGEINKTLVDAAYAEFKKTHAKTPAIQNLVFNGVDDISISHYGFTNWTDLLTLNMSDYTGTIEINSNAFEGCSKLNSINFPANIEKLGIETFKDDVSLTELRIPAIKTWIDKRCFKGCTKLVSVYFLGNFKYGDHLFDGCTSLKTINYCGSLAPTTASWSWDYSMTIIGNIKGYTLKVGKNYPSTYFGNILVKSDMKVLGNDCTEAEPIPDDAITIGKFSFLFVRDLVTVYGNGYLYKSHIDQAYTEYKKNHTNTPKITKVKLAGIGDISIGDGKNESNSFNNWTDLISVDMSENKGLCSVNSRSVQNCPRLNTFVFSNFMDLIGMSAFLGDVSLTEVSIPPLKRWIDKNAFEGCTSLTTVRFNGYFSYGDHIFEGCTSLRNVYYCGTEPPKIAAPTNPDYTEPIFTNGFGSLVHLINLKVSQKYNGTKFAEVDITPAHKILDTSCSDKSNEIFISPFTYTFVGPEVTISGSGEINKQKIDAAFKKYQQLVPKASIINSIKFAGTGSVQFQRDVGFNNWKELVSIDMSEINGIATINSASVQDCVNLKTFIFPPNLELIGSYVFKNDISLVSLSIPGTRQWIDKFCFYNCSKLRTVYFTGAFQYGEHMFEKCLALQFIYYCGTVPPEKASPSYADAIFTDGNKSLADKITVKVNKGYTGSKFAEKIVTGTKTLDGNCIDPSEVITVGGFKYQFVGALATISGKGSITKKNILDAYAQYNARLHAAQTITELKFTGSEDFSTLINVGFNNWKEITKIDMSEATGVVRLNSQSIKNCTRLSEFIFPPNLDFIGVETFAFDTALKEVTIPQPKQYIDSKSFNGCTSLAKVKILGYTKLGEYVFDNCKSLRELTYCSNTAPAKASADYKPYIFTYNMKTTYRKYMTIYVPSDYSGNKFAEAAITSLNKILDDTCNAPSNYIIISPFSFTFVDSQVTIEGSGTIYKDYITTAFMKYKGKNAFAVPVKSLRFIGKGDFFIKDSGFMGYTDITSIDMENCFGNVVINSKSMIGLNKLTKFLFPQNLDFIGSNTFENCTSLTDISIGKVRRWIDKYCFKGCTSLRSVKIQELPLYGNNMFEGCTSLFEVIYCSIEPPVKALETYTDPIFTDGNYSFASYISLKVPKSYKGSMFAEVEVTKDNKLLDDSCNDNSNIITIGAFTFTFNGATAIIEGSGLIKGSDALTAYNRYKSSHSGAPAIAKLVFISSGNLEFQSGEKDNSTVADLSFTNWNTVEVIDLSKTTGLVTLGSRAFRFCTKLRKFNFPSQINYIGAYTFEGDTSLTEVRIPGVNKYIDYFCFKDCTSLTTVYFLGSFKYGNNMFEGCTSLVNVYYCGTVAPEKALPTYLISMFITNQTSFADKIALKVSKDYTGENFAELPVLESNKVLVNCEDPASTASDEGFTYQFIGDEVIVTVKNEAKKPVIRQELITIAYLRVKNSGAKETKSIRFQGSNSFEMQRDLGFNNWTNLLKLDYSECTGTVTFNSKAMMGLTNLKEIIFPPNIELIGANTFSDASSITTLEIPAPQKWIDHHAFSGCSSLKTVKILGFIKYGNDMFEDCHKIEDIIYCGDKEPVLANPAYEKRIFGEGTSSIANSVTVLVPRAYESKSFIEVNLTRANKIILDGCGAPSNLFYFKPFTYTFYDDNEVTIDGEGALNGNNVLEALKKYQEVHTSADKIQIMNFVGTGNVSIIKYSGFNKWESLVTVNMSRYAGTITINSETFINCSNLKNFIFPEKIELIGSRVFKNDISIVELAIPAPEKWIDMRCFEGCTSLKRVRFLGFFQYGEFLFEGCISLTEVYYCNSKPPVKVLEKYNHSIFTDGNLSIANKVTIKVPRTYTGSKFAEIKLKPENKVLENNCNVPNFVVEIKPFTYTLSGSSVAIEGTGTLKGDLVKKAIDKYLEVQAVTPTITTLIITGSGNIDLTYHSFESWTDLTTVNMENAEGRYNISSQSFNGCTKLQTVLFPQKIDIIGSYVFDKCTRIVKLKIPAPSMWIDKYCFTGCTGLTTVQFLGDFKYGENMFEGCTSLRDVYFCGKHSPTKASPKYADTMFGEIASQVNLEVTKDYLDSSFVELPVLESNKVTGHIEVDKLIFDFDLPRLNITGSGNVDQKVIEAAAATKCPCLISQIKEIEFFGEGHFSITRDIGFWNVTSLTSVKFSNTDVSNSTINSNTFRDCTSLSTFKFPPHVDVIGTYAFSNTAIEVVYIPQCRWVDFYCFKDCSKLHTVHFLGFLSLGFKVFDNCLKLKNVYYCHSTPPTNAGTYTNQTIFTTNEGKGSFASQVHVEVGYGYTGTKFGEITIDESNKGVNLFKFNDVSYQLLGTELVISGTGNVGQSLLTKNENATVFKKCPCELDDIQTIKFIGSGYFSLLRDDGFKGLKHLSKVEFLNDDAIKATSINSESFKDCISLSHIVFPKKLSLIGSQAFLNCAFKSLVIPAVDNWIDVFAFSKCKQLKTVHFAGKLPKYGHAMFNDCTNLKYVYYCSSVVPVKAMSNYMEVMFTLNSMADQSYAKQVTIQVPVNYEGSSFAELPITEVNKTSGHVVSGKLVFDFNLPKLTISGYGNVDQRVIERAAATKCPCLISQIQQIEFVGDGHFSITRDVGFWNVTSLISVKFLNTGLINSTINTNTFRNCTNLKEFTFPMHVDVIGTYALANTAIEEIYIPQCRWVDFCSFKDCSKLHTVHFLGYLSLGFNIFDNCKLLKNVYYCDSVPPTNAGTYTNQTMFTLNEGKGSFASQVIVKVGYGYTGTKFGEITITESNKNSNMANIDGVIVAVSDLKVTFAGSGSVSKNIVDQAALKVKANCPCSVDNINYIEFVGTGKFEVVASAFENMDKLVSVKFLNENATEKSTIFSNSFNNCNRLKAVTLPKKLQSLGANAFKNTSIKYIIIPPCDYVDSECFGNCSLLKSVYIKGFIKLGEKLFHNCTKLIGVYYCSKTPPAMAMDKYAAEIFTMPSGKPGAATTFKNQVRIEVPFDYTGTKFAEQDIGTENRVYRTRYGKVTYEFNNTKLTVTGSGSVGQRYITYVADAKCPCVTNLSSITHIEFVGTGIFSTEVNTGFWNCSNLISVKFLNTGRGNTTLNSNAFRQCTKLKEIQFPQYVGVIGSYAFENTAVEEVFIPECMWVDFYCFKDCSKLHTVHFLGYLSLGFYIFDNCKALRNVYYCYSEPPTNAGNYNNQTIFTSKDGKGSFANQVNVEVGYGYNGTTFGEKTVDTKKPPTNSFINGTVVYIISAHKLTITGNGTVSKDILSEGMANNHKCPCNADDIRQIEFTGNGSFNVRYMIGFKEWSYLESVKFLNTGLENTTIGSQAFYHCTNLREVVFPQHIDKIGTNTFTGTALVEVWLPSLTWVDFYCFKDCTKLKTVHFTGYTSLGYQIFENCVSLRNVYYCHWVPPPMLYTNEKIFTKGSGSLASKVNVEVAHNYTGSKFAEKDINNGDKTADMHSDRTVNYLFEGTKVTISGYGYVSKNVLIKLYTKPKCQCQVNEITEIDFVGDGWFETSYKIGFSGMENLEKVNFKITGKKNTTIGSYAFRNCYKLHQVTLPKNVDHIGSYAFENTALVSIDIPSCKWIDFFSFKGCTQLKTVTFKGIIAFGNNLFEGCTSLETVVYCSSVPPTMALPSYPSVIFTNNGGSIAGRVKVEVPPNYYAGRFIEYPISRANKVANVVRVDDLSYRFDGTKLSVKGLVDKVFTVNQDIVNSVSVSKCECITKNGIKSKKLREDDDNDEDAKPIIYTDYITEIAFSGDCSFVTTNYKGFMNCKNLVAVYFYNRGQNNNTINSYFTRHCTSLKTFYFPEKVGIIGSYIFEGTQITSIQIPTCIYIDFYAFKDCSKLTSVTFTGPCKIGEHLFENCASLKTVSWCDDSAPEMASPKYVKEIFTAGKVSFADRVTVHVPPTYNATHFAEKAIKDDDKAITEGECVFFQPTPPPEPEYDDFAIGVKKAGKGGMVAGIVIAVLVIIALTLVAAWFIVKKGFTCNFIKFNFPKRLHKDPDGIENDTTADSEMETSDYSQNTDLTVDADDPLWGDTNDNPVWVDPEPQKSKTQKYNNDYEENYLEGSASIQL